MDQNITNAILAFKFLISGTGVKNTNIKISQGG
jgi:hypothetical protein